MTRSRVRGTIRVCVYVLVVLLCCALVAALLEWEFIPTRERRLGTWWRVLSDRASSVNEEQLTRLAGRIPEGEWFFGELRSDPVDHQTGVVMLGNGQKVSFCFISHHSIDGYIYDRQFGLDSIAICRAQDLEIRSVGCGCCEFGGSTWKQRQPKDLIDFVRLLAECGKVEIVKCGSKRP